MRRTLAARLSRVLAFSPDGRTVAGARTEGDTVALSALP